MNRYLMHETITSPSVAGIILAAGESRRFLETKQLSLLNSKTLLSWVIESAILSLLSKVYLVLGHRFYDIIASIECYLRHPKLSIIRNRNYKSGLSRSLQVGLSEAFPFYQNVMFVLADQPFITSVVIDRQLYAFQNSPKRICVLSLNGKQRNPTIFNEKYFPDIHRLKGDVGARNIIAENFKDVLYLDNKNESIFMDIDTKEDLNTMKKLYSSTL